jgi:hypothetical protein
MFSETNTMSDYVSIDLTKIRTIVLHNRTAIRRDHMNAVCKKSGLNHVLYECIPDESKLMSGIRTINKILSEMEERETFEPFLFLEDDVSTTEQFTHVISVPANADCVYLGLADCYSSYTAIPTHKWRNKDEKLVQIRDMLSLHAFVVTSKTWLLVLISVFKDMLSDPICYDIPVARMHHLHTIYGFKNPFFYQDGHVGGQEGPTKITFDLIRDRVLEH